LLDILFNLLIIFHYKYFFSRKDEVKKLKYSQNEKKVKFADKL